MRLCRAGPQTVARTVFGICHPSAALSRKIPHRVDQKESISRKKSHNLFVCFVFVDTLNYALQRMRLRGAGPPTVAWTVFGICQPSAALLQVNM